MKTTESLGSPDFRKADELFQLLDMFVPPSLPGRRVILEDSHESASTVLDNFVTGNSGSAKDANVSHQAVDGPSQHPGQTSDVHTFAVTDSVPIAAVDCSMARIGETAEGVFIALRAALVLAEPRRKTQVRLYRTGPIFLPYAHKLKILHAIGTQLGQPDFYVLLDKTDPSNVIPKEVKLGAALTPKHYADRLRTWLERLVQRQAAQAIDGGLVMLDGALTLHSRDTPVSYMKSIARACADHDNDLIAISKQSELQVQDRSIRFWLDDVPSQACYRNLTSLLESPGKGRRGWNRTERNMGAVLAARFSRTGPVFRVDAVPPRRYAAVMNRLFSSALLPSGYPDVLVRAHGASYFSSADISALQAQACAQYHLNPQPEGVDLGGIFGPFGGRFK